MTSERWERVKVIVADALEATPESREEFVLDACGGDEELHSEVSRLLQAAGDPSVSPAIPFPASPPVAPRLSEGNPSREVPRNSIYRARRDGRSVRG